MDRFCQCGGWCSFRGGRRGSVLTRNDSGLGVGAGYDEVEQKLDDFNQNYTSQVEDYAAAISECDRLAQELVEGRHASAASCTEEVDVVKSHFDHLKKSAGVYQQQLDAALARESNLNQQYQYFCTKAAGIANWIESIEYLLQKRSIGETLDEVEANNSYFEAEYGQAIERVQGADLAILREYAAALDNGQHARSSEASSQLQDISHRLMALPGNAEQYRAEMAKKRDSERDFFARLMDLEIKAQDFSFRCKQMVRLATRPVVVFSVSSAEERLKVHTEQSVGEIGEMQAMLTTLSRQKITLHSSNQIRLEST